MNEHEYFRLNPEICDICGPLKPILEALNDCIYNHHEHGNESINSQTVLSSIQENTNKNGHWINFYPSDKKGLCSDQLVILALNGWPAAYRTHDNLNCGQALEILAQHVQGSCCGVTRWATIVTAKWDNFAYDKWRSNIDIMRQEGVRVSFFQLGPKGLSVIAA